MKYGVEVLDSVELDEMTQKEIESVASELESEFQRNLQSTLREIVVKEMDEVKSIMQTFEGKFVELEERLLAAHQDRIAEVITRQQDVRKATEDKLTEVENRLIAEHRMQMDKVEKKLVRTQYILLGFVGITLLAAITGIFL